VFYLLLTQADVQEIAEVAPDDLRVLAQESPGSARGVQNLERAAASLYKALQAGMDQANAEVAATIARMREYQDNSQQFCKRIQDYLDVAFKHQVCVLLVNSRQY
jgi:Skp family chaperone for outer membrane proteins